MKFLIAGLGSIGRRHFRNLLSLGERDIVLLRSGKSTLPDEELAGYPSAATVEAALAYEPDAVIVSNPTSLHLDIAIPAADAGCHLLIEKPIAESLGRIEELRAAVNAGGGQVLVGFQFRFHPTLKVVKDWIDSKAIGDASYCHAHWGEYLPDWHPWEDFRNSYASRSDLGGGVTLTLCHPLDYLRWLFGDFEWLSGHLSQTGPWDLPVEDTAEIVLGFSGEWLGSIHLDFIQRPAMHTLLITGAAGTILWNAADGRARLYQASNGVWQDEFPPKDFSRNDLFMDEMRHFLAIARGEEVPVCDLQDGIEALKAAIGVRESSLRATRVRMREQEPPA